jgi:hypothetical protein
MAVVVGVAVAVGGWQCVVRMERVSASILIGDNAEIGVLDGWQWQGGSGMVKWQWQWQLQW